MKRFRDLVILLMVAVVILIGFWSLYIALYILLPAFLYILLHDLMKDNSRIKTFKLTYIDYLIIGLIAFELLNYVCSIYPVNSTGYLIKIISLSLFYFFIRYAIEKSFQLQFINQFIAAWGALLSLVTLLSFSMFKYNINYAGFANLLEFRNMYMPMGFYSNAWVTVLLLFLPFQIIVLTSTQKTWLKIASGIFIAITIVDILLSFSRGGYIAIVVFVLLSVAMLLIYKVFSFKKLLLSCVTVGLIVSLMVWPLKNYVLTTVSMGNTTSHQRSFEGRTKVWQNSFVLIKEKPLLGIGSDNFNLRYNAYNKAEESGFVGRIANTYMQILIEKGILGLLLYGLLFYAFFYYSFKNEIKQNKASAILFIVTVVSLLVRELSFNSIFEMDSLLIFVIIIILNNTHNTKYVNETPEIFKIQ